FIDGNQGNDTASLGAGDDVFQWDPGDGSDVVEGGDGTDTLLFNGANVAETFDISANGSRVRLTRDIVNVTMDVNGVEHIQLNALGGADTITVNDLSGTGVTQVAIDLASPPGSGRRRPRGRQRDRQGHQGRRRHRGAGPGRLADGRRSAGTRHHQW